MYKELHLTADEERFMRSVMNTDQYMWYHNLVLFTNRAGTVLALLQTISMMVYEAEYWCIAHDKHGPHAASGYCIRAICQVFCLEYAAALSSARRALALRPQPNVRVLALWIEVVALARIGNLDEARFLFHKMWKIAIKVNAKSLPPFPRLWDESAFTEVDRERLVQSWKTIRIIV